MAMQRQEFFDLCPAYALGLLDGEDLARFRAALASADAEQRAAYQQAVNAAANLSLAAPDAPAPSPAVFDKLMARVAASAKSAPSVAGKPSSSGGAATAQGSAAATATAVKPRIAWILPFRFAAGVAVGLAFITLGLLAYVSALRGNVMRYRVALRNSNHQLEMLRDSLEQKEAMLEIIKSDQMQMVVMSGQDADPSGYGKIIWDPVHKKAILHVSNLPPEPADKDYQLWVIRDKVPVDAGVFQVRAQSRDGQLYKIDQLVEADKSRINAFAITLEPKGGLPKPSGKMYLLGSI